MTLDVSIDEYNETAVKIELAALYGVPVELISLDATSGSLQITVTIATTPSGTSGGDSSAAAPPLDIATLLAAVESVDDSALGASMAVALGAANITVASAPVLQATMYVIDEVTCSIGHWCTAGNEVRKPHHISLGATCHAHHLSPLDATWQIPCDLGTYNPFADNITAEACLPCMDNAITLQVASVNRSQCICDAANGFKEIVEADGERKCVCPFGQYKDASRVCVACPKGTFKSTEVPDAGCEPCSESTTLGVGAQSDQQCVCLAGYFNTFANGAARRQCLRCEPPNLQGQASGASCTKEGVELTKLPLHNKYWRSNDNSTFIWNCFSDGVCVNGSDTQPVGQMFLRNNSLGCLAGHSGPFCEVCIDNHYKSAGKCIECTGEGAEAALLLIPGAAIALALLLCFGFVARACFIRQGSTRLNTAAKQEMELAFEANDRNADAAASAVSVGDLSLEDVSKPNLKAAATSVKLLSAFKTTTSGDASSSAKRGIGAVRDEVRGEVRGEVEGKFATTDLNAEHAQRATTQKEREITQAQKVAKQPGKPSVVGLCSAINWSTLQIDFKILISLIQVLGSLSVSFSIPFPPLYSTVMSWLNVITLSSIFDVMPLSCQGITFNFHDNLRLRTIFPVVFLMFSFAWVKLCRCNAKLAAVGDKLVSAGFFLIFLIYPSTSQNIFNTFNCVPLDDPEHSVKGNGYIYALRVDVRASPRHSSSHPSAHSRYHGSPHTRGLTDGHRLRPSRP